MSIQATGIKAYTDAIQHFNKVDGALRTGSPVGSQTLFSRTLDQSLLTRPKISGRMRISSTIRIRSMSALRRRTAFPTHSRIR